MRKLLCLLAAFGTLTVPGRAADTFDVYAILPVTGSAAFIAKSMMNALGVIEHQVNATGGIRGRPLHFVIQDDQSNPAVSVQLLTGILTKKPPIVIGPALSSACNATMPLFKDGPVDLCLSPGIHPPSGSYVYVSGPATADLFSAITRYVRERGLRKIAVIFSTDASGQDSERSLDQILAVPENRELSIVDREHFNPEDLSAAAQMARAKASAPDIVFAWCTGTAFGTLLRGIHDIGLTLPVFSNSSNMSYSQMAQYASFTPSELLFPGTPTFTPDQLPNGALKKAVTQFLAAFKANGTRPEASENQVWDPTLIAIDALRKYGPTVTPDKVRDYINSVSGRTGTYGKIDYQAIPQRGVGVESVVIQRYDPSAKAWIAVSNPGGDPLR